MLDSIFFFFSSRRRHTRCALVTGVQTCALPISASRCGRSCATPWLRVPGWCSFAPKNATERLRIRFMPFIAHAFDGGQAWRVMNAQEILMAHLRSEEHTSELQSLMRISYAVFCLKKKKINQDSEQAHDKPTN